MKLKKKERKSQGIISLKNKRLLEEKDLNEAYLKIMYWFFAFPTREVGLNDLVDTLKISKTTANRVVKQLIEDGFLKLQILGNMWRITADNEHMFTYSRKISFHLQSIYESGIIDEIYKQLPNAKCLVLFGSYRKGDDTEDSDIDIAVEVVDNNEVSIHKLGILDKIGYRENVPVTLHIFSRNKVDLNLFANIANGIVLKGFLEVRP